MVVNNKYDEETRLGRFEGGDAGMTVIRKYLSEKAQGLVEYVLILAFIAGVQCRWAE